MEPRRAFLATLAATLCAAACGSRRNGVDDPAATATGGGGAASAGSAGGDTASAGTGANQAAGGGAPLECTETADSMLGPYYRAGAPFREDLTEHSTAGDPLVISGKVLGRDCEPIAGALLDVWQANTEGRYDNDGVDDPPPDTFVLRGRITSGADGSYSLRTVIPGHYLNGAQFRPAHVHVTVSALGYEPLTTQLYFEGDPYNGIDPIIIDSLIMPVTTGPGGEKATQFDFVLPRSA